MTIASESLADRVKRLRLSRHLSRNELALAADVSKSHVHQIETGQRTRMRLTTLARYARALGVPESYIDYGYKTERTDITAREVDLTTTLRQATRLEDRQIQQVISFIQTLSEAGRDQGSRRTRERSR